jgi:hypothetical protein
MSEAGGVCGDRWDLEVSVTTDHIVFVRSDIHTAASLSAMVMEQAGFRMLLSTNQITQSRSVQYRSLRRANFV